MLCFYNFTTKLINLVLFENLVFPVWDYLALIVCYSDKISYYVCNFYLNDCRVMSLVGWIVSRDCVI